MTTQTETTNTSGDFMKKEFSPLAEGEYLVRMNRVSEVTSKAGNKMLKVGYQVINKVGDPDNETKSKNRLIFENFLLDHANPKVGEITRDRIGKYLKAVGVENGLDGIGGDFSQLERFTELPFIAVVGIQEGNNGYSDSNKIKSYKRR